MTSTFSAALLQLRMRGATRLAILGTAALLLSLAAADRSVIMPFAESVTIELGPICCFLWVPFLRAVISPRAWTLEVGYLRFVPARLTALALAVAITAAAAASVAIVDPTVTVGMAVRNALITAALLVALTRVLGPDPASLVPVGLLAVLLLAGKHDDNTVSDWAVFLQPEQSAAGLATLVLLVAASVAAESTPFRSQEEQP